MLTIYVPTENNTLRPKRVKRVELRMRQMKGETTELPIPVLIMEDDSEISASAGNLYYDGQFIGATLGISYERGALSVMELVKRLLRDL